MNAEKSPDAFRTISEVAEDLDLPAHVLRFWETKFSQIKPMKRGGGRRYYRPDDVLLLRGIQHLLYDQGYTIKGVQKILKTNGVRHVIGITGEAGSVEEEAPAAAAPTPESPPAQAPPAAVNEPQVGTPSTETPPREPRFRPIGPRQTAEPTAQPAPEPVVEQPAPTAPPETPPAAAQPAPVVDTITPVEMPMPRDILPPDAGQPSSPEEGGALRRLLQGREPAAAPLSTSGTTPRMPPAAVTQLAEDDIRTLQSTLFDLLECKRILDQARQKSR